MEYKQYSQGLVGREPGITHWMTHPPPFIWKENGGKRFNCPQNQYFAYITVSFVS